MTRVGSSRSSRNAPMQYFRIGPTPWLSTSHPASVSIGDPQFPSWMSSHFLLNLEANHFRILVTLRNVVDRHCEALGLGMGHGDGGQQIGRESGNTAFAWQ